MTGKGRGMAAKARESLLVRGGCALVLALLLCALPASLPVRADDASISWGGAPRLLKGHRWVEMRSEVVRMTVGERRVHVDCRFVFENRGPACSVRMGFPDNGEGGYDEDDAEDREEHRPPRTREDCHGKS